MSLFKKGIFLVIALFAAATFASAQQQLEDGGFDRWRGGGFAPEHEGNTAKCCGPLMTVPVYWTIVDQAMQLLNNQMVFKETDSASIHSGSFSAKLYTDTTTVDSAGDVSSGLPVPVPGIIASSGIVAYGGIGMAGDPRLTGATSIGWSFSDNPLYLNFYIKTAHLVTDTMHYTYSLTRWDSIAMKEDTLAINDQDIPDAQIPGGQWVRYTDTIHYLTNGVPDTVRFIFFGGRNADISKVGNATWLDDIIFNYDSADIPSAIQQVSRVKDVQVYPNPTNNLLNVKVDESMFGCSFIIYDAMGRRMNESNIETSISTFSTGNLSTGIYLYRMLNKQGAEVKTGKFLIER